MTWYAVMSVTGLYPGGLPNYQDDVIAISGMTCTSFNVITISTLLESPGCSLYTLTRQLSLVFDSLKDVVDCPALGNHHPLR